MEMTFDFSSEGSRYLSGKRTMMFLCHSQMIQNQRVFPFMG